MYAASVIRERAVAPLRAERGKIALDIGRRYGLDCLPALLKVAQKAPDRGRVSANDAPAVALGL